LRSQADDHQPLAVEGAEVTAVGAVEIVAVFRPVGVVDHHLGDLAEVAEHRQGDILERDLHQLAAAGAPPVALGGQKAHHRHLAGDAVPGGEKVVDGSRPRCGARHHRKADLRVGGVIDLRAAVAAAHEVDHDQIVAPRLQRFVVEPAARGEIGDEHPRVFARRADHAGQQFLPFRFAEIDRDRPLALVEASPEQALLAIQRHRPAGVVEPAADRIEADHVGTQLRQRHAAERHGDEGRAFDDSQPLEDSLHKPLSTPRARLRAHTSARLCAVVAVDHMNVGRAVRFQDRHRLTLALGRRGANPQDCASGFDGARELLGVGPGDDLLDDILDGEAPDGGSDDAGDCRRDRPAGKENHAGGEKRVLVADLVDEGVEHLAPRLLLRAGGFDRLMGGKDAEFGVIEARRLQFRDRGLKTLALGENTHRLAGGIRHISTNRSSS
jgi:hypothetical protein